MGNAANAAGTSTKNAAAKVAKVVPVEAVEWGAQAVDVVRRSGAKAARIGLSPKRVVALHRKRGHAVVRLSDVRKLDLEQVHEVRGRAISWTYPAVAALSGAGSGLAISGGQLVLTASAGAAAAPSVGLVAGAFAIDSAAVLALSSRAVGQISLLHGYDPEEPEEKLFILSVVNAGTAVSAAAKTAAFTDVSRLTQALVRGKTWETLNQSVVSQVTTRFAGAFSARLTKSGLGKIVPAVGIVLGGAFNWATLEGIVDAADLAYRRRFLMEKYPQLLDGDDPFTFDVDSDVERAADATISVVDEIADAGGPDLR